MSEPTWSALRCESRSPHSFSATTERGLDHSVERRRGLMSERERGVISYSPHSFSTAWFHGGLSKLRDTMSELTWLALRCESRSSHSFSTTIEKGLDHSVKRRRGLMSEREREALSATRHTPSRLRGSMDC